MAKNTIKLKNYSDVMEEYTTTAATVLPGCFVELTSAGLVQKHGTAKGGLYPPMVVCEDELRGKSIDDAIAASSKAQVWIPYRGDVVNAWLKDGENVAVGDKLESAGDGTLQKYTNGVVIGTALTAVDLSASANTTNARIQVRIA